MIDTYDHHRVSPEGQKMGVMFAKLADAEYASLSRQGEECIRCKTCAFRAGTVPNGCPQTQLDVYKSIAEDVPFHCHQKPGAVCEGWFLVKRIADRMEAAGKQLPPAGYEFSPPD